MNGKQRHLSLCDPLTSLLGSFSASVSRLNVDHPYGTTSSRQSDLSAVSKLGTKRPSIITSVSNDGSDYHSNLSHRTNSPVDGWQPADEALARPGSSVRALAWRDRGRATAMLRTCSDGADVVLEEDGLEWEVINPHGTGAGRDLGRSGPFGNYAELRRRHSLQNREAYAHVIVSPA